MSVLKQSKTWKTQQLGTKRNVLDWANNFLMRFFDPYARSPNCPSCIRGHRDTRRALTRRFPLGVFYRVEENFIVVVSVMHGSRDPQRWKQRT